VDATLVHKDYTKEEPIRKIKRKRKDTVKKLTEVQNIQEL